MARYDMWGNELPEGADPGALPPGTERGDHRRSSNDGRAGRQGRGGGAEGPDTEVSYGAREVAPVWGKMSGFEFLSFFSTPSQHLEIRQESGKVRFGVSGRARTFVPGEEDPVSLTDRYGSRSMRGGWMGDAFVVASFDGRNVRVDDSVRRLRDDRLERNTVVHVTGAKTITVHSTYRRALGGDTVEVTEEGPPSPVR